MKRLEKYLFRQVLFLKGRAGTQKTRRVKVPLNLVSPLAPLVPLILLIPLTLLALLHQTRVQKVRARAHRVTRQIAQKANPRLALQAKVMSNSQEKKRTTLCGSLFSWCPILSSVYSDNKPNSLHNSICSGMI